MKEIAVDWKMELPDESQISEMWKTMTFQMLDGNFKFIDLLKKYLRSGYIYFKGVVPSDNAVFDFFSSRGRLGEIDFFNKFLLSETVLASFPTDDCLCDDYKIEPIEKSPDFKMMNSFAVDAEFASLLCSGGAYGSTFRETAKKAKALAQEFCRNLFDEEYESIYFYKSEKAWNSWFIDDLIDDTYIIISLKKRTIWILAFTDVD